MNLRLSRKRTAGLALIAMGLGAAAVGVPSAASALPTDRAYEMMTPEFTQGGNRISVVGLTDDGSYGILGSAGIFADTPGMVGAGGSYAVIRTPEGWVTKPLNPDAARFPFYFGPAGDVTPDLRGTIWEVQTRAEQGSTRSSLYVRRDDGHGNGEWEPVTPSLQRSNRTLAGTSEDLSTVVIGVPSERPALTDDTEDARPIGAARPSLYRVSRSAGGDFELAQIAYKDDATMFPTCGVGLGGGFPVTTSRGAVSPDANTLFFSFTGTGVCRQPGANRAWAWTAEDGVRDMSESQCTTACGAPAVALFEGASRDGRRAYFSSAEKLVDEDAATSLRANLYEYDFDRPGNELRPITVSGDLVGAGVVRLVRLSEDGSRAYFAANGRALAGPNQAGDSPVAGQNNLYVYHRAAGSNSSSIDFIGTLAATDSTLTAQDVNRQAQTAPESGRFFLFASRAPLTADKLAGDSHPDLYRYDAETEELTRVWSGDASHNGAARTAGASMPALIHGANQAFQSSWSDRRRISDDGNLVYVDTDESLVPEDENVVADSYLWDARTNQIDLISGGTGTVPVVSTLMTPSGSDLLFTSPVSLLPEHTSTALAAYTARVGGGGFPTPPTEPPPCIGESCQGDPIFLPPLQGPPATLFPRASDNVVPTDDPPRTQRPARVTVTRPKAVRSTRSVLRVRAPARGRIDVTGSGLRAARKNVSKAGATTVAVRLSQRATARLRRTGSVNVNVRVRFRTSDGATTAARTTVRFRATKASSRTSTDAKARN